METNKQNSGKQKTGKTKLNNMIDRYKRTVSARSEQSKARIFGTDILHRATVIYATFIFVAYTMCRRNMLFL